MGTSAITLDVGGVPADTATQGALAAELRRIIEHHRAKPTEQNIRDVALISLLAHLGLRRGEVVSLDVEHVDLHKGEVWILGKGRRERERVTLPAQTCKAVAGGTRIRA